MATDETDPVAAESDNQDLYEIASWEERSILDRVSVAIYSGGIRVVKILVVLSALLILIGISGLSFLREPLIGVLTVFSAIPTLLLAGYVWYSDITESEPCSEYTK